MPTPEIELPLNQVVLGDSLEILRTFPSDSVDSVVTDPPASLAFMGSKWDSFESYQAFQDYLVGAFTEALRVLKPGGYALVWAIPRTSHHTGMALERSGFEVRDGIFNVKDRSPEVEAFLDSLGPEQLELLLRAEPTDCWMLHVFGCLSEDTEILTDKGWVNPHTCVEGAQALCYNLGEDTFSWQGVEQVYVYPYHETVYHLVGERTNQLVSKNHRCLVHREGQLQYDFAERLTSCETVPYLEDLPGLLEALSDPTVSIPEEVLLSPVLLGVQAGASCTTGSLSCVQEGVLPEVSNHGQQSQILFPQMSGHRQGEASRCVGALASCVSFGSQRLDRGKQSQLPGKYVRLQEPCLEGGCNILPKTRELWVGEVCEMPPRVFTDGSEGWVRGGTSIGCSCGIGTTFDAQGVCSPFQPQPHGQPIGELGPLCYESRPQAVRASRFTRTDLVRVEPIPYDGIVWCVRVPTGAFVARRKGRVFITGNSGFPKSLNVGKAIDKLKGAERKVVGKREDGRYKYGFSEDAKRAQGAITHEYSKGWVGDPSEITEPATEEATKWEGWGTSLKPAVEVWWLVRKPLTRKSVAEQVLETGTGAINIDGCRIQSGPSQGGTTSGENAFGQDSGWNQHENRPTKIDRSMPAGRWPADLTLQHSPGCKRVGTKKVPTGTAYEPDSKRMSRHIYGNTNTLGRECGYASEDGTETVDAYECVPGCPVAALDEQSGDVRSAGQYPTTYSRGGGYTQGDIGRDCQGPLYSDAGGASRFFNVFEPDPEVTPPAGRWPADLTLQHSPGCKRVGTKKVPTGTAYEPDSKRMSRHIYGNTNTLGRECGYASEDGTETVDAYECVPGCPVAALDEQSGETISGAMKRDVVGYEGESSTPFLRGVSGPGNQHGGSGGASRFFNVFEPDPEATPFFYVGKVSTSERNKDLDGFEPKAMHSLEDQDSSTQSNRRCLKCGKVHFGKPHCECEEPEWEETKGSKVKNFHPTAKSIKLMRHLVRLVTPPNGIVLDPFSGSGSTLVAAIEENKTFIGIEKQPDYHSIAQARVSATMQRVGEDRRQHEVFDMLDELPED